MCARGRGIWSSSWWIIKAPECPSCPETVVMLPVFCPVLHDVTSCAGQPMCGCGPSWDTAAMRYQMFQMDVNNTQRGHDCRNLNASLKLIYVLLTERVIVQYLLFALEGRGWKSVRTSSNQSCTSCVKWDYALAALSR